LKGNGRREEVGNKVDGLERRKWGDKTSFTRKCRFRFNEKVFENSLKFKY